MIVSMCEIKIHKHHLVLVSISLMILLDCTRKGLVTGSIPTENLPLFHDKSRDSQLFKPLVRNKKSPRFFISTVTHTACLYVKT